MAATGLTRSTAIDALDTLTGLGLLSELPNARAVGDYRKGRPARRFVLDASAAVLVGIDAGESHLVVVVTDLRSRPLATVRVELVPEALDAVERAGRIVAVVDEALGWPAGHAPTSCRSVPGCPPGELCGAVAPAPLGLLGTDQSGPCRRVRMGPILRVENDASLAAVAEGAVGAAVGCRDYISLLAGSRFGAGVVVDGHLLRGAHGGVGEMVAFDHVVGVGSADGLGVLAATRAVEALQRGELDPAGPLAALPAEAIDARVVLELAHGGDPDAMRIAEGSATCSRGW
ncbi:ROK family protein [Tessaracoccus coleopterorum]|uniref:ROK family protein n=1 Tax=Tessaracoccus coleopterorum TaxID=2714950 RepID=UPI0018D44200|nr:ROK family protein [Tessaracoccus coleopterorum]